MTTRACVQHGCDLLEDDESCPQGHFCTAWYVVQDGKIVAEVDENRVRWLGALRTGRLEDELVPDPDLRNRRPWRHDASIARVPPAKLEASRRLKERRKAEREGREVPTWARAQRGAQPEADSLVSHLRWKLKAIEMEREEGA